MTEPEAGPDTAFRVADRLAGAVGPWEVCGVRARRFELYFQGARVETVRGPVEAEGFGLRRFRTNGEKTGVGFHSSTDLSPEGIRATLERADGLVSRSSFPTSRLPLSSERIDGAGGLEIVDQALWDRPVERLEEYGAALLAAFGPERDVVPTFGAVRAVLEEVSIANSAGAHASYRGTLVDLETIVKASGGAEGRPPGEYWATGMVRRLDPKQVPLDVRAWSRHARAVRDAHPSPTGNLPVILPPEVLAVVLGRPVATRLSGSGRLQKIALTEGARVASEAVSIRDDGLVPWAPGSRPADGEGTRQRSSPLVDHGTLAALLYDTLHAGAFDRQPTGNAGRFPYVGLYDWLSFRHPPGINATTVSFAAGTGGSDAELVEAVGDGLWIQEIGFPNPDPITSAFGGEIRVGYRIRGGKIREPIRGGTVGGVVLAPPGAPSLLANAELLGSHPTLAGGVLAPPILVRTLAVAGDDGPPAG